MNKKYFYDIINVNSKLAKKNIKISEYGLKSYFICLIKFFS